MTLHPLHFDRAHCTRAARRAASVLLALAAVLSGCSTVPPAPQPAAPPATPAAASFKAEFTRVPFDALPPVAADDWRAFWPALLLSCRAQRLKDPWRVACADAQQVDALDGNAVRAFVQARFEPWQLRARPLDAQGAPLALRERGLVTGYYEPLLSGSRTRSARHATPLHRVPDDLLVIDLASVYPELAGKRVRGRLEGRRVVPYPERAAIVGDGALDPAALVWVDDPVDAFFLQVQGSGRVQLDDGTTVRVGYADQNGRPYRAIGRWLVEQGELPAEQVSMQAIRAWAARNPARLAELLNQNPSYVFFRELPLGDPKAGPVGAAGVALTPGVSVAADPAFVPVGTPLVLTTTHPASGAALTRAMVAQDTGGAIKGPLRFDLFWGFGNAAGELAGRQRHEGAAWLLLPRGMAPG